MKRKLLALFLVLSMCVGIFAGCSNGGSGSSSSSAGGGDSSQPIPARKLEAKRPQVTLLASRPMGRTFPS